MHLLEQPPHQSCNKTFTDSVKPGQLMMSHIQVTTCHIVCCCSLRIQNTFLPRQIEGPSQLRMQQNASSCDVNARSVCFLFLFMSYLSCCSPPSSSSCVPVSSVSAFLLLPSFLSPYPPALQSFPPRMLPWISARTSGLLLAQVQAIDPLLLFLCSSAAVKVSPPASAVLLLEIAAYCTLS